MVLEEFNGAEKFISYDKFDKLSKMHLKIKLEEVIQEKLKEAENKKKMEAIEKFKNRRNSTKLN